MIANSDVFFRFDFLHKQKARATRIIVKTIAMMISPIFLALTAGAPFYKGKVSDWDARWNIIADSVDDRTK